METEQMIIYLTRLETVLDNLGKLLFKAHLKVPLTLDREQSQELLRQNNRFEFRYQQLRNQKKKVIEAIAEVDEWRYLFTPENRSVERIESAKPSSIGCGTRVQSAAQN